MLFLAEFDFSLGKSDSLNHLETLIDLVMLTVRKHLNSLHKTRELIRVERFVDHYIEFRSQLKPKKGQMLIRFGRKPRR